MTCSDTIAGLRECRLCGSRSLHALSTMEEFTAVRCGSCGLISAEPLPTPEKLCFYYSSGESTEDGGTEVCDSGGRVIVPHWKEAEVAAMVALLERHVGKPGRLLDVGCLWGIFLSRSVAAGWEGHGFEPWVRAASYCREVAGLNVISGVLEDIEFPVVQFDAITLFDVIEHLREPFVQLSRLVACLRPGGCLVVSTPNYAGLLPQLQGLARRVSGRPWAHLTPPFHLYDFTPRALELAFYQAGLAPMETMHLTVEETMMSPVARTQLKRRLCGAIGRLGAKTGRGDRIVMVGRSRKG